MVSNIQEDVSVALRNLAVGLQLYLKETPSLVSFKDFGKEYFDMIYWRLEDHVFHKASLNGFFVRF